ncbi:MAG: hypothetical protein PHH12_01350 [Candidatus Shapirobacteria bacterium]|nr:hypothetical protein [Candidatus Shapirobacteria bacterium]
MTKIRILIYFFLLIFILISLFVSIFGLIKKNNSNNLKSEPIEPTPFEIIEITWPEAVDLIQNCQIKTVFQKHNLEVTLTHKDNRIFKTIEPKIDDIFKETNHLRSDCNDIIQTITE